MTDEQINGLIAAALGFYGSERCPFSVPSLVARIQREQPDVDGANIAKLARQLIGRSEYGFRPVVRCDVIWYEMPERADEDFDGWKY